MGGKIQKQSLGTLVIQTEGDTTLYAKIITSVAKDSIEEKGDTLGVKFGSPQVKETTEDENIGGVLYICFPDFPIDPDIQTPEIKIPSIRIPILDKRTPEVKIPTQKAPKVNFLGHAGVLIIKWTGLTKYYEYGRYSGNDDTPGYVRNKGVPDVIMENGKPTYDSLKKTLNTISNTSGQGGRIQGAYFKSTEFDKMNEYAQNKLNESNKGRTGYNKDREHYSITSNNCGTFAANVLWQDPSIGTFWIVNPTPRNIVDEFWEEGGEKVLYENGNLQY